MVGLAVSVQQLHADARPDIFQEPDAAALRGFFAQQLGGESPLFVAVCDGRPAGYLLAECRVREADAFKRACALVYVHQLAVDPSMQSRGVGCRLMRAAVDLANTVGATVVRLDSWSFNTSAHDFFGRQGFQPVNTVFERVLP